MPLNKEPKILIIIPAFNEGETIKSLLNELKIKYPNPSCLIINDASTDNTEKVVKSSGLPIITLPYNLGIGGAVQTGYQIALSENYDAAVQLDGDGQHDPASLNAVLKPILSGELDLCIGSRFLNPLNSFKSTFLRRVGIKFFSFLLSSLAKNPVSDPTSGYRAVSKLLIAKFADYYPTDFPEPEAIQIAKRYNARIGEVPVKMKKRAGGISSIRAWKSFYYMIKVTIAIFIDTLKK